MSKNIIICSDGTGNTAIKGRGTNVFKLFEGVDLNGHRNDPRLTPQVAIYDDGVGTEDFKPLKIFAGATGFGLARNVRQLYKGLVRLYDPGDRIFVFGFSRGAFTVRTLVGMISKCGILDPAHLATSSALDHAVAEAYRAYRQQYQTKLSQALGFKPNHSVMSEFKQVYVRHEETRIAFGGVWDTVDAVGTPFHISDFINIAIHRYKFPDHRLSPLVDFACHALSIDDQRHSFHPLLWEYDSRIEQVWFAGAHSNVGGGYPKQGMSLVALDWMMRKAELHGLRVLCTDRELYREHGNVDDKLYNPRAGMGFLYRWLPRDMAAMCANCKVPPAIHISALERIAHGTEDYAPGNLAPDAAVVITPSTDDGNDKSALARADGLQTVLRECGGAPLLSRVKGAIALGHVSYYVYLISCTAVLFAASVPEDAGSRLNPWVLLKNAALLMYNAATFQFGPLFDALKRLTTSPSLLSALAGGFVVAWFLQKVANHRMSAVFSEFWHGVQPKLRESMKIARHIVASAG